MRTIVRCIPLATVLLVAGLQFGPAGRLGAQTPSNTPPYLVEWVYKVKWGHQEEFFDIFKKTQVPVLDEEKQLGYVVDYTIYSGTSHRTGEDVRYDYRVVIAYKNEASSKHGSEVEKQVFPDQAAFKREDQETLGSDARALGRADSRHRSTRSPLTKDGTSLVMRAGLVDHLIT